MTSRVVTEAEFRLRLRQMLARGYEDAAWVTGPGRSGAIAAVYASHFLHIPFVPFGSRADRLGRPLLIDTARETGATMRKAERRYPGALTCVLYEEPPRVAFWYEARKPQRYRHERRAAA